MSHVFVLSLGIEAARRIADLSDRFPALFRTKAIQFCHLDASEEILALLRSRKQTVPTFHLTDGLDLRLLRSRIKGSDQWKDLLASIDIQQQLPEVPELVKTQIEFLWESAFAEAFLEALRPGLLAQNAVVLYYTDWASPQNRQILVQLEPLVDRLCTDYFESAVVRHFRVACGEGLETGYLAPTAEVLASLLFSDQYAALKGLQSLENPVWEPLVTEIVGSPATQASGDLAQLLSRGSFSLLRQLLSAMPWPEVQRFLKESAGNPVAPVRLETLAERLVWLSGKGDGESELSESTATLTSLASDDRLFCEYLCQSGESALALALFGKDDVEPATREALVEGYLAGARGVRQKAAMAEVVERMSRPPVSEGAVLVVPDVLRSRCPPDLFGKVLFSPLLTDQVLTFVRGSGLRQIHPSDAGKP